MTQDNKLVLLVINVSFVTPWNIREQELPDIFRGYRNGPLASNGLTLVLVYLIF